MRSGGWLEGTPSAAWGCTGWWAGGSNRRISLPNQLVCYRGPGSHCCTLAALPGRQALVVACRITDDSASRAPGAHPRLGVCPCRGACTVRVCQQKTEGGELGWPPREGHTHQRGAALTTTAGWCACAAAGATSAQTLAWRSCPRPCSTHQRLVRHVVAFCCCARWACWEGGRGLLRPAPGPRCSRGAATRPASSASPLSNRMFECTSCTCGQGGTEGGGAPGTAAVLGWVSVHSNTSLGPHLLWCAWL